MTCQVPALVETGFSPADGLPGGLVGLVQGLVLHGWDEPELAVEAAVVVPVDVLGDGDLEVVGAVPGAFVADEFGLEQGVERLGHRIDAPIVVKPRRRYNLTCAAQRSSDRSREPGAFSGSVESLSW